MFRGCMRLGWIFYRTLTGSRNWSNYSNSCRNQHECMWNNNKKMSNHKTLLARKIIYLVHPGRYFFFVFILQLSNPIYFSSQKVEVHRMVAQRPRLPLPSIQSKENHIHFLAEYRANNKEQKSRYRPEKWKWDQEWIKRLARSIHSTWK